jgi:HupE / UreJ protein
VHGLGFAGALKEIGLPQKHLSLALLTFNVGVELGQLLVVGLAFGLVKLPLAQRVLGRARKPALYAIGGLAAYWSWLRVAAI